MVDSIAKEDPKTNGVTVPSIIADIKGSIPATNGTSTSSSSSSAGIPTASTPSITTTAPAEGTGLFTSDFVSPTIAASLPSTYRLRALCRNDYKIGFLDVLRVLTTVGDITEEQWVERYDWMAGQGRGGYYLLVIEDEASQGGPRIVATGALFVERKFIHNLGLVGHIEDIAVSKDQQGKKLGLKLIQALDFVAEKVGCYKCILDCSEANEGFYVKCGYKRAGLEMAHYYDGSKSKDAPVTKSA